MSMYLSIYVYILDIIYIIYKNIYTNIKKPLKRSEKLSNAFYASSFSFVVPNFAWSLWNRIFDANPKALESKRNYLERIQA